MDKERIRIEIKQLQDRLNILSNELEKCQNQPTLSIRKPQLKERYYVIGYSGVDTCMNTNDDWEERLFESGNYWFTKEEAEFEAQREKYTRLYRKYIKEHSEPMDSRYIKLERFYAYWDILNQTIQITYHTGYIDAFQIYGSSEEVIQDAIKFVGEDNFKKYILQVKCEEDNIISDIDKPRREGNYVYFGSYPQSDSSKKEPIKWQILEEKDGELLLLSDKIIDCNRFNAESDNNYKTSGIRKWLNAGFINTAFNESQKNIIITSNIVTDKFGGGTLITNDKIFLLSKDEVEKYFKDSTSRQKQGTQFAKDNSLWTHVGNGNSCWWLRSPGYNYISYALTVGYCGSIEDYDYVYLTNNGVVPALRIKASDVL